MWDEDDLRMFNDLIYDAFPESETVEVTCPGCGGDGEYYTDHFNPGSYYGHYEESHCCPVCDGNTTVDIYLPKEIREACEKRGITDEEKMLDVFAQTDSSELLHAITCVEDWQEEMVEYVEEFEGQTRLLVEIMVEAMEAAGWKERIEAVKGLHPSRDYKEREEIFKKMGWKK